MNTQVSLAFFGITPGNAAMTGVVVVILITLVIRIFRSLLHICPPNEVLIFSGNQSRLSDGTSRGYRVVVGRGVRHPLFETVQRMSLTLMEVPISIRNAYSKGGIPLNVDAIANVKISSDPLVIGNAIERFLGRDPNEIRRVAKETLEGHLRGVLARLTPEEVNEDRIRFGEELSRESELDLQKLGIHLDTLKIQHVSDDQHYLDSIGREAIALVVRDAEMSESDAKREAELAVADNNSRASIARSQAEANIAQIRNELRKIQADLESEVKSEDEVTLAAARETRARAEQELQQVRSELEGIRLQADTVLPAEARREAQEFLARGEAAIIRERGNAAAQAVQMMNEAWTEAGAAALAIYLIDDIENILRTASRGVQRIKVDKVQVVDGGDGRILPQYVSSYPAMLNSIFAAVAETTGIDIQKEIVGRRNGQVAEQEVR